MNLVERESALLELRSALDAAAGRGHVMLISGEAGIGKTSLLRSVANAHPNTWWGACDALETPHPLGPLIDIARDAEAAHSTLSLFRSLDGPRMALFQAVLDELRLAA